jgi:hypothetical protein
MERSLDVRSSTHATRLSLARGSIGRSLAESVTYVRCCKAPVLFVSQLRNPLVDVAQYSAGVAPTSRNPNLGREPTQARRRVPWTTLAN